MGTGKTISTVGNTIGGLASMVPGIGTGIGAAVSGISTLVGGALEASEAEKQKEQPDRVRKAALGTKPQKIQDEYLAKLRMQKMAALSGLPSLPYDVEKLGNQTANTARSIRESSPNGAATLAAMSAAKGLENSSLQDILSKNETYKANELATVANTLGEVGAEKQSLQNKANKIREQGLMAASALDAAGTYNKMEGINKILGAVGSTAASFGKMGANSESGKTDETSAPVDGTVAATSGVLENSPLIPYAQNNPAKAEDNTAYGEVKYPSGYSPTAEGIGVKNSLGKSFKFSASKDGNAIFSDDGMTWEDNFGNPVTQ